MTARLCPRRRLLVASKARNVVVQHICPGRAVDHAQLPTDAVVDALVLRALAVAPFVSPTGADCSSLAGLG